MEYTNKLEYQREVVETITDVFDIKTLFNDKRINSNPSIIFDEENIKNLKSLIRDKNIKIKNKRLKFEPIIDDDYLNIDVKMETGTGKTYVYTKTILELNRLYKIKKFIILVPSVAIKVGTENFIYDSREHFNSDYQKYIDYVVQLPLDNNKKKKTKIYEEVKRFVEGEWYKEDKVNVLIVNSSYFAKDKYGSTNSGDLYLDQFESAAEALRSVRPFLIIDEPHKFDNENKCMQFIKENVKPQCIIRFGATFKDYKNLIYDLDVRESFGKNLIKGINIHTQGKEEVDTFSFYITNISKGDSAIINYKNKSKSKYEKKEVKIGSSLDFIDDCYKGKYVEEIFDNKNEKGIILNKGDCLLAKTTKKDKKDEKDEKDEKYTIYSNYTSIKNSEYLIQNALDRHFEKEKNNFLRSKYDNKNIIKTICLFFIGSVESYRENWNKNKNVEPELKKIFEEKLKKKLESEIKKLEVEINNCNNQKEKDILKLYKEYLEETKKNLKEDPKKVHGGYFSGEKNNNEESEYSQIIVDKEKTLNIYNKDNTYNTFRFIFSLWTLREGWDNPNVFTIVKLKESGSEISKLQEVGRGLRLPVDIKMKRIQDEQFYLDYIVNYSERDFALKLYNDINKDYISYEDDEILKRENFDKLAENLFKLNEEFRNTVGTLDMYIALERKLQDEKLITRSNEEGNYKLLDKVRFFIEYSKYIDPEILDKKLLINRNEKDIKKYSKINSKNFDKIKQLWGLLNESFIISYDENAFSDEDMQKLIVEAFDNVEEKIFREHKIEFSNDDITSIVKNDATKEDLIANRKTEEVKASYIVYEYNEFLKIINKQTNISINVIHKAILDIYNKVKDKKIDFQMLFSKSYIDIFINEIRQIKFERIEGIFNYVATDVLKKVTALTDEKGNAKSEIQSNLLGTNTIDGYANLSDKYLYEDLRYDSDIEKNNILNVNYGDDIEVFAKIPKNSIKIPKVDGKSCSPDFMYVVKNKNEKEKKLNLVIESKDYETKNDMRKEEDLTQKYMKKYFEKLKENADSKNIDLRFNYQFKMDKIVDIIEDMLNKNN